MATDSVLGIVRGLGVRSLIRSWLEMVVQAALLFGLPYLMYQLVLAGGPITIRTAGIVLGVAAIVATVMTGVVLYGAATNASWYAQADTMRASLEADREDVEEG
jgi:hypothetical protein